MGRLKEVRKYVNERLEMLEDHDDALKAAGHLYSVSMSAQLLAQRRGENAELAGIAGLLHDLYAYESGSYEDHAHKGADLAREILGELDITTPEETAIICSAIYHHDDKASVDEPMDEILKDADAMHHIYNDLSKEIKEKEAARYEKLRTELGIERASSKKKVNLDRIIEGLEWVNDETTVYFDTAKGELFVWPDYDNNNIEEDELEDGVFEGRYIRLPDQKEINEYHMMETFAYDHDEKLVRVIQGRGAFRRFKDTAMELGLIGEWYEFRDSCYRSRAEDWCRAHDITWEGKEVI